MKREAKHKAESAVTRIEIGQGRSIEMENSLLKFLWAVMKAKWIGRSKRHKVNVYAFLITDIDLVTETCPETDP